MKKVSCKQIIVVPFRTKCGKDCIYATASETCGYNQHDRKKDEFGDTVCNYTKADGWHWGRPNGRIKNDPYDCEKCGSKRDGCMQGASKAKCTYCPVSKEREFTAKKYLKPRKNRLTKVSETVIN